MAIITTRPLEQSASVVLSQIEAILLNISAPHNFAQYAHFRESVRTLSTLLPVIQHAVEGVTVSPGHQNFVRTRLRDVHEKLSKIGHSIEDHYQTFHKQTRLHPVSLRIFFFTPAGEYALVELPAIAAKVYTLYSGPTMEAIRRADSEGTLVDVRSPFTQAMLFSRLKPGLSALKPLPHRGIVKVSDISPQDKIIILLGASGSGKSTFINTAAQRQVAEASSSLEPCTLQIQAFRVNDPHGKPVVFIDTPGLDETNNTGGITGILELSKWVSSLHERNIFPSGLVYLHNMSATRINPSHSTLLHNMCGQNNMSMLTVATTMAGEVAQETQEGRTKDLEQHWRALNVTITSHDNTTPSAWSIVDRMTSPRPLKVSSEMAAGEHGKGHLGRTSLGKFLLQWLRMVALLVKKQLKRLKSHWDHLSSVEGMEETLEKKLRAISACIAQLNDTVKTPAPAKGTSTPHFSEHFDDRMDSVHATTYRLIFMSQLTSELQHLKTLEQHVPTPCLGEALTFFSETLETLRWSERPSIQLFRLLRDLYVLAAVTLDAALQGKPDEPFNRVWAHISEALIRMKPSIQQMNSSNVMSIVSAHKHLASCQQMVGLAYDIFDSPRVRV